MTKIKKLNLALILASLTTLGAFGTVVSSIQTGESWRIVLAVAGFAIFLIMLLLIVWERFKNRSKVEV